MKTMRPQKQLLLLFLFLPLTLLSQSDEKAEKILERLSQKQQENKTIRAAFTYRMVDQKSDMNEEMKGKIELKGEKFFLELGGQSIYNDGETRWVHLKEDNEVQISKAGANEEEAGVMQPSDLFTIWEKDFKYEYFKRIKEDGTSYHVIKLYPKDPSDKAFHTVELKIEREKEQIAEVKVLGKQGTNYIYEVDEMEAGVSLNDERFVFDSSEHPGVEKVDLR